MSLVGGVGVAKDALADGAEALSVSEQLQLLNTSRQVQEVTVRSKQLLPTGH